MLGDCYGYLIVFYGVRDIYIAIAEVACSWQVGVGVSEVDGGKRIRPPRMDK